ncbi:MAG: phage holin family protein [Spirulinaceae cyanobacterium]
MLAAFLTLLATALSLLVVDLAVPGVNIATFAAALIAAASLGAVNAVVKPVLSTLSLPLNFVSFGAFTLVVNGICFWLASLFVPGFAVHGILGIVLGPVILSFVNTFILTYFAEKNPQLNLGGTSQTTTDSLPPQS